MVKKIQIFITLFLIVLFSSCSQSSQVEPLAERPSIDTTELLNKVTLGMTRAQVESLLGKPYSVLEEISKDPDYKGVEVTVLYSPKLRLLEQQIANDINNNKDIETSKSILSAALSIVGSIIPSAGIASSVGNSAVGVAGDLALNPIDSNSLDPNKIESALVVYRDNKVQSMARRNLSSVQR